MDSFEILYALKKAGHIKEERDPLWWPNSGSFEVVIGAVLTQNTKWQNVQKALSNLKNANVLDLDTLCNIDSIALSNLIKPSGFYNTKTKYLKTLAKNIKNEFTDFKTFCDEVTSEWLLSQKGIGFESADSILCFACLRDEMVADAYSHRLISTFGIELEGYMEVKYFLTEGIINNLKQINILYEKELSLNTIFARFHGKIVEYCAANSFRKKVTTEALEKYL